jgi:uncharacterized OB-fold protein
MSEHAKPLPRVTPDTQPFWDALRARKLQLPFCDECGRAHLPPGPVCPFCFSDRLAWHAALGTGRISSWTVVHKAWFPAFAGDVPSNVVQVELDEGPRLTASIVGAPNDRLAVGLPVVADFDDVTPDMTLLRFRPADR